MTEPASKAPLRKRLMIVLALTSMVMIVAWVTYFLLNFDLNDYRRQIERKLSSLLSSPVTITDIHYNFYNTNLALHMSGLQIGDETSSVQVDAADVMINLQWRGLLEREIKLTKISMVEPKILFRSAGDTASGAKSPQVRQLPIIIDQTLLQNTSIDSLEVLEGSVTIDLHHHGQPQQQVAITNLNAVITDIHLNGKPRMSMKGALNLPGQRTMSMWHLAGESSLGRDEDNAPAPFFNIDLGVEGLDLSSVKNLFAGQFDGYSIAGKSSMQLHFEGSLATAVDFRAGLSSSGLALTGGPYQTNPVHVKKILAAGHLQTRGDHPGVSGLTLQIDESSLAGSISWTPQNQPFSSSFILLNSTLEISRIKPWIPDAGESWEMIRQKLMDQGSVHIEQAELTLHDDSATGKTLRLGKFKGELQNIAWALMNVPDAEITSMPFELSDRHFEIMRSHGHLGSLQIAVSASGVYQRDAVVLTTLDFDGEIPPDKLFEEWHIPMHSLVTSGQVGIKGHIEGPVDQLSLDMQADLSHFSLSHPAGLRLTPGPEDKLTLHGSLSPEEISLDHGSLKWSIAKGHVSGTCLRKNPESLSFDAFLAIDDLTRLAETLPILDKMQLQGQADLSISQRGLPESNPPEMILTLRDAGLHATRFIADLNQINGRVKLTPMGLSAENLRVHLGQSPAAVQVKLDDFNNPKLFLDVKAPAIHANELVFPSDKALLRNIDGHLEIDRNGLVFAPVDVHLDGGTDASVRGNISFHPPFVVQLDITSEFAQIAEVIGLWSDHSKKQGEQKEQGQKEAQGDKPRTSVRINAKVKRGDLYGMSFHDASGLIVPTRERLNIHPLDFSVGEGFCNAQVITEFSVDRPTLLRISGHAEDVDALEVYRELLNQKSIVRGKLRGDFYLIGDIGANYLPTSYGNFSIQIHDGVLHEFPILSKVFSLLNVSQIFALQLPDMDREGMPFDTLSANFQLDKGVLKSDDLQIHSEAMNQSYVGQLNLVNKEIDLTMAIHPLGTVDKIVTHIPVAGWLLTGKDRALLTANFSVKGKTDDVSVSVMPLDTITEPTLGLLKRTLQLPYKLFTDPKVLFGGEEGKE